MLISTEYEKLQYDERLRKNWNFYRHNQPWKNIVNLNGIDLSYEKWSFMDFRYCNFKQANFESTNLRYTDFRGSDLTGANFTNADLYGVNFEGANLYQVKGAIINLNIWRYPVYITKDQIQVAHEVYDAKSWIGMSWIFMDGDRYFKDWWNDNHYFILKTYNHAASIWGWEKLDI